MIDLAAIVSRRWCDWCNRDAPPSWMERRMRLDQLLRHVDRPLHERAWIRTMDLFTEVLTVWKLASAWHHRFHPIKETLVGVYVNPKDMTKEQWLELNATAVIAAPQSLDDLAEGDLPVCLVDNGWMTAAAIAYSEAELAYFTRDPDDPRPMRWYSVPALKLTTVIPTGDLDRIAGARP